MPRADVVTCRRCGKHRDECGELSWTRLCRPCSVDALAENIAGLATMTNPARDRWRRGMLASVYPELLDHLPLRS